MHIGLNYSHCMPHSHRTKSYWQERTCLECYKLTESWTRSNQEVVRASLRSNAGEQPKIQVILRTGTKFSHGEIKQEENISRYSSHASKHLWILNHAGMTNNYNLKLKISSEEVNNNHESLKPLPFSTISTVLNLKEQRRIHKRDKIHLVLRDRQDRWLAIGDWRKEEQS